MNLKQPVLKPQDLLIALKLSANRERVFTFNQLARELNMSDSEIHAGFLRAEKSRLITRRNGKMESIGPALKEFIEHGVKYAFPSVIGAMQRGVPTGVGAQKIWAGTVTIHPNAKTGAHHHGELESVIYVIKGKARMRWGEHLEFTAEAGPGDFIYVPPFVPHQEINASPDEALECVLVRSDNEAIVMNLDIEPVEQPENVFWVDPIHKDPKESI